MDGRGNRKETRPEAPCSFFRQGQTDMLLGIHCKFHHSNICQQKNLGTSLFYKYPLRAIVRSKKYQKHVQATSGKKRVRDLQGDDLVWSF